MRLLLAVLLVFVCAPAGLRAAAAVTGPFGPMESLAADRTATMMGSAGILPAEAGRTRGRGGEGSAGQSQIRGRRE